MALAAQSIGSNNAQIGTGKEIGNQLTWRGGLAEFVAALQNMSPLGPMRTARTRAPEFAIVIAVVAIGAENLNAHGAAAADAVQVQHIRQQAGLWQRAAPVMHHGMAGSGRACKLRDH